MSINVLYVIREGFTGLRRARVAAFVTVSTIAITLTLLNVFLIMTVNIRKVVRTVKTQIYFEVFVDPTAPVEGIEQLKRGILGTPGVERAVYISADKALQRFKEEFGEDPAPLLGENPLPASFQVWLKPEYRSLDKAELLLAGIGKLPSVDEVSFHGKFFRLIEKYSRTVLWVDFGLMLIVVLATLLLVNNTMRLTLLSQAKSIQIMRLVGATRGFIRRPYLFQGFFQGALGGGLAALISFILIRVMIWKFNIHLEGVPFFFWGPVAVGGFLGLAGSLLGLRRHMQE
jgi:cell division transport system permease protein